MAATSEKDHILTSEQLRGISISFERIHDVPGCVVEMVVEEDVCEAIHTLLAGIIRNLQDVKFKNTRFIVQ